MSEHAVGTPSSQDHGEHDDPMSHVPPGSIWPLITTIGLLLLPFGVLAYTGLLKETNWGVLSSVSFGGILLGAGALVLLFGLMGWAHQIIYEKRISHDLRAQQSDLKMFILLFLGSELAAFGAIFGYFYHRKIWDPSFAPLPGMHLGGAVSAYATFILLSSSVTCEIAHRAVEHGNRGLAKLFLLTTLVLGVVFLGFQGYEYGELIQRGFTPVSIGTQGAAVEHATFASVFYTATGFHGLHVAIGLVMLVGLASTMVEPLVDGPATSAMALTFPRSRPAVSMATSAPSL